MDRVWLVILVLPVFLENRVFAVTDVNSSSTPPTIKAGSSVGGPGPQSSAKYNVTSILEELLTGYDKRLRPNYGGYPVNVSVSAFIEFIGDIDEINMEFTTILYFRQYWQDPRLEFNHTGYTKRLAFNPEMLKFIWVPDTHFPGIKDGIKHKITDTNEVIRIWPNGTVLYSMRLKVISQCLMDLHNFPMDKQKCSLNIEAFSYDDLELTLNWSKEDPVVLSDSIEIPSYALTDSRWFARSESFTTGRYSLLTIEFSLNRRLGFHVMQIYLPSYIVVVLAWVSFWVDREQTTARIAMGVITVLTMATLIGSARVSLPQVSYIKSLEWFLVMCFLFVFFAILEYVLVSYLVFKMRVEDRERTVQSRVQSEEKLNDVMDEVVTSDQPPTSGERPSSGHEAVWVPEKHQVETVGMGGRLSRCHKGLKADRERTLNTVELFSRLLFPLIFICLNIAYWLYYTTLVGETADE